jgi:exosome complex RNA-binding protein Rrp42 (RNase PH superfamily)
MAKTSMAVITVFRMRISSPYESSPSQGLSNSREIVPVSCIRRECQYSGVPPAVAQGLAQAASKGRYYQQFVRGRYPAVRIG